MAGMDPNVVTLRRAGMRVLVVYEAGRAGEAAVDLARELAERGQANLTVVSVAPLAKTGARCGGSALDYNDAVREAVARDLEDARRRLGEAAHDTAFDLLSERADLPLEEWSAAVGFDLVLLPARRRPLRSQKHPAAAALRRTGAEVRIVSPRVRPPA